MPSGEIAPSVIRPPSIWSFLAMFKVFGRSGYGSEYSEPCASCLVTTQSRGPDGSASSASALWGRSR